MVRDLITFSGLKVCLKTLVLALVPLFWLNLATADVLDLPGPPAANANQPSTGMSMQQVLHGWGEPQRRHQTVSDPGTKQRPPINRWDYASFSVVFERDKVIHTVSPQYPPEVVATP
jgi:hypothetical protein